MASVAISVVQNILMEHIDSREELCALREVEIAGGSGRTNQTVSCLCRVR